MNFNHRTNQSSSVRLNLLYVCGHQKHLQSFVYLRLTYLLLFVTCVLLQCWLCCSASAWRVYTKCFCLFFLNASSCREHPYILLNVVKWQCWDVSGIIIFFQTPISDDFTSPELDFFIFKLSSYLIFHFFKQLSPHRFASLKMIQINPRQGFHAGTVAVCCPVVLVTSLCWRRATVDSERVKY